MEGISKLYRKHFGHEPGNMEELPCSVSTRRYFRITDENNSVIATFSPDVKESIAFTTFADHFHKIGIHVPEIIAVSEDLEFYLQTDLGDIRMHELITSRIEEKLNAQNIELYKASINELIKMQVEGNEGIDYSICVPRPSFDRQAVMWDLNHFKYYFLKPLGIPFDENSLEQSFIRFADYIAGLPECGFMFRDFQTRNIMLLDEQPYFIDFQGGRKGPFHYDLASLVLESKTGLTEADRNELIHHYLETLSTYRKVDHEQFRTDFFGVALIRALQVLGTYGLRGNIEKKAVFIQSIPNGLKNLEYLLSHIDRSILDESFYMLLDRLVGKKEVFRSLPEPFQGLTITITSFSYRKPLPDDISGNGGGFVYDCRFLNNPGRHEQYKQLTGLDQDVKLFLKDRSNADEFVASIKDQLQSAIIAYKSRNFKHLMVSFGCTGGRHRSVYVAREVADWCRQQRELRVIEYHREIGR